METIKTWQERVAPSVIADFTRRGYGTVHAALFAEIAELRAAIASQAESAPVVAVDERSAFEKAINAARFFPRELDFSLKKSPSGKRDEYINTHLESCWTGWQARANIVQCLGDAIPITCQTYRHDVGRIIIKPCGECNVDDSAKDVADTNKILADNYLRATCSSAGVPHIERDAALAAVEKIRPVTWTIGRADFVDGPDYKGTEAEHWSVCVEDHPEGMFLYRHEVIAVLKGGEARPLPKAKR